MKKIRLISVILFLFLIFGCGSISNEDSAEQTTSTQSLDSISINTDDISFAAASSGVKGCDLSWVTQMEAAGYTWKNTSGTTQDIFLIMKNLGFTSVRLRVWVNPSSGWCGQSDTVAKAKRAAAQGMSVYLTFHYSDSWADPGKQYCPSAWSSYSVSNMKKAVYNHTYAVCKAVKAVAAVGWVSIGNETNCGMIWTKTSASGNNCNYPSGYGTYPANYAAYVTSGYNGAKAAGCTYVGVHLSNMYDTSLWTWNIGLLKTYSASYDFVAGSLYPTTSNYTTYVANAKTTKSTISSTFGKYCVLAEFGIDQNAGSTGYKAWTAAQGICSDSFYWEPECYGGWQGYTMGAFTSAGKPSTILTGN